VSGNTEDIARKLGNLGISGRSFRVGEVYYLDADDADKAISLPRNREGRESKARTVVIIGDDHTVADPLCTTIMVVPTSSRLDLKTCHDIEVSSADGGVKKNCICMCDHVQPILKTDIKEPPKRGALMDRNVLQIKAMILSCIGWPGIAAP
jgi:mRNA-degrading endonuclease toxin of MazEF toxin-antitoxin module